MRCFIAIPIDPKTTMALQRISLELQKLPWKENVRWFPAENYHLTLQFLGSKLEDQRVAEVMESMDNWFSKGMSFFDAEIRKIQPFPTPKQAHTLIASLDATQMMQYLQREIEEHLKPIGLERRKQSFRPHISLGRIKTHCDHYLIKIPPEIEFPEDIWLRVDKITLYQSQLTKTSPVYRPLKTIELET